MFFMVNDKEGGSIEVLIEKGGHDDDEDVEKSRRGGLELRREGKEEVNERLMDVAPVGGAMQVSASLPMMWNLSNQQLKCLVVDLCAVSG